MRSLAEKLREDLQAALGDGANPLNPVRRPFPRDRSVMDEAWRRPWLRTRARAARSAHTVGRESGRSPALHGTPMSA